MPEARYNRLSGPPSLACRQACRTIYDRSRMTAQPSARWSLTREAFDRLLQELGPDREAAAREYETLRKRLVVFFDWRGAEAPEVLADEALDRLARRLAQHETIENVRAYLFGVARNVWLEAEKCRARARLALAAAPGPARCDEAGADEARVAHLELCLRDLPDDARALIVGYYQGAGQSHLAERKLLAQRLGITYTTLKTRAHRIRVRLEECLRSRLEGRGDCDR